MKPAGSRSRVSRRVALQGLLVCGAGAAAEAPRLQAAAWAEFRVELPAALHRLAGTVRMARVAIATPPAFDAAKPWPLLVVSATSDPGLASSRRLLSAYRAAAAAAGWIALAADPDPAVAQDEDTLSLRFALLRTALAVLAPLWRDAAQPALAFAGFSGGAKYAGWLAAMFASQRERVTGVFLAGVNEEPLATPARRLGALDATLQAMPVFLQGGRDDTIATPRQHQAIEAELRERGFRAVRLELVPGGHEVDSSRLQAALTWFAESAALPR